MHDASLMCCRQSIGCLDSDIQDIAQLQRRSRRATLIVAKAQLRSCDVLPECLAIDKLSGNKMSLLDLPDLMNGDDVRMIERRGGARLLLKTDHTICVPGEIGRQQFERHLATERHVLCQVNLAHST